MAEQILIQFDPTINLVRITIDLFFLPTNFLDNAWRPDDAETSFKR